MNVSQASKIWLEYHRAHSKHNTVRAYQFTIEKFNQNFANINLNEVSPDDILDFMAKFTEGRKPQTKRIRFSHLTAFSILLEIISIAIIVIHVIHRCYVNYSDRKQLFIGTL